MSYKLIASDLDGTLFNSHGEVSVENRLAITETNRRGAAFAIATGRTLSEIPDTLLESPDIRYIIYANGASVFDKKKSEKIIDFSITGEDIPHLLETLFDYDAHLTVRSNGVGFVEEKKQTPEAFAYYNVHPNHAQVTIDYSLKKQGLYDFAKKLERIEVTSAYFHDASEREECAKRLEGFGLRVARVAPVGLEIFGKEAGKGAALAALAEYIGCDISECIGVGDSENDTTLILEAGLGLATENASSPLKKIADEIICSNDGHIAKYILDNYL